MPILTSTEGKEVRRCLEIVENQMHRVVVQTIDKVGAVHDVSVKKSRRKKNRKKVNFISANLNN